MPTKSGNQARNIVSRKSYSEASDGGAETRYLGADVRASDRLRGRLGPLTPGKSGGIVKSGKSGEVWRVL